MNVEFQLILIEIRVHLHSRFQQSLPQVPQPGDMAFLQVAKAPDIPPLDQHQKVQGAKGLPVPIKVWKHEESVLRSMPRIPQDHVLLLRLPVEDVEHPVQPPLLPLLAHIWPDVVLVDRRCLGHRANRLR